MSRENLELVRRGFEAWPATTWRQSRCCLRDLVAPGFEMRPLYLDKVYTGADGLSTMWAEAISQGGVRQVVLSSMTEALAAAGLRA